MPSLFTKAALVASASLSLAAPTANLQAREGFSVKQVSVGTYLKHGPSQMMKTYKKFAHAGATAPADVVKAAQDGGQQGSVDATPEQYDQAYLCPVKVGENTLNLDFDSGSSDLWVFSTLTPSNEIGSHNTYDVSHGQEENGDTWNISYGDGSGASGTVYADTVVVGSVTATSQAVEAATSVSAEFVQDPGDGLLGLAFSSINTVTPDQATTFFDTVLSSLNQALFTADLTSSGPGEYTFGYIDSSKYSGSITYVPVDDSQGFWQFTAGGYSAGGSGNSSSGNIGTAILDTGTSLLLLPQSAVQGYYSGVSGASYDSSQGGYTFPCSANLPDFVISIGGQQFTVSGSDINYAPISGSTCFGGIQSDSGIGFSIFGDVFLRNVYAIFDKSQSTPRIGLASQ